MLPHPGGRLHGAEHPQRLRSRLHRRRHALHRLFGPTSRVRDQGLKIMSSLCANLAPKEEGGINQVLAGIPDPVGTFYRYGLPKSMLRRKINLPQ